MGQHNPNLGLTKELESLEVFSKHLSQLEVNIQTLFNNINNNFNQPYTNEDTQEKVVELVKQVEVIEELINSNGVGCLKLEEASVDIKDIKTQSQLAQKRTQTIIGTHKKLLDASHSIIANLDRINLETGSEESNNNGGGATGVNTPI